MTHIVVNTNADHGDEEEVYMALIREVANQARRAQIEEFVHELGMDAGGHLDPSVTAICDLFAMLDGKIVPAREGGR